jgi:hypothetical protein
MVSFKIRLLQNHSNLYDFGLGFISSLPYLFGIKGFVVVVVVVVLPSNRIT